MKLLLLWLLPLLSCLSTALPAQADRNISLLLMGNSSNADKIFKALLERLLGDRATPWQWENYVPYQYIGK